MRTASPYRILFAMRCLTVFSLRFLCRGTGGDRFLPVAIFWTDRRPTRSGGLVFSRPRRARQNSGQQPSFRMCRFVRVRGSARREPGVRIASLIRRLTSESTMSLFCGRSESFASVQYIINHCCRFALTVGGKALHFRASMRRECAPAAGATCVMLPDRPVAQAQIAMNCGRPNKPPRCWQECLASPLLLVVLLFPWRYLDCFRRCRRRQSALWPTLQGLRGAPSACGVREQLCHGLKASSGYVSTVIFPYWISFAVLIQNGIARMDHHLSCAPGFRPLR
jgi:hypothetical protein